MLYCGSFSKPNRVVSSWAVYSSLEYSVYDRLLWDHYNKDKTTNLKGYLKFLATNKYFLADSIDKGYEAKFLKLYNSRKKEIDPVLDKFYPSEVNDFLTIGLLSIPLIYAINNNTSKRNLLRK